MDIKDFGVLMKRELENKFDEGYKLELREVVKNNGILHYSILVRNNNERLSPSIYLESFYYKFSKGMCLSELVDEFLEFYEGSRGGAAVDVDNYYDFAKISARLSFKMINFERNKDFLRTVPYKKYLDLALVPIVVVDDENMGTGAIVVTNNHLETWEVSEDELWENAFANAPSNAPIKMMSLFSILEGCEAYVPEEYERFQVLTNTNQMYGASVIVYKDVLKNISKKFNSDLFVIPSSIHEVIVVPTDISGDFAEHTLKMIKEVNRSVVENEEILSDNLYRYSASKDEIEFAMK